MKLLFFLNHPAHFHLFKNSIEQLKKRHHVDIIITKKDILEDLVKLKGWDYFNLVPEGRRKKGWPILLATIHGVLKTEIRLFSWARKHKYDLLVGTEATLAHIGWLLRTPSLLVNEDDTKATPENYLFYPFATKILMPECTDVGKWQAKKVTYRGYHELAYLHPKYFTPNKEVIRSFHQDDEPYFIVRLAELSASHDVGKTGITDDIALKLIDLLKQRGKVYITAERSLKPEFEEYRININPLDIFHALYFADMYIGDSQTMAAEAAVLGTPSIRYNDFVRRLGYLDELEDKYQLTYGFKTEDKENFFLKIEELLNDLSTKDLWTNRRDKMLSDRDDVVDHFNSVIESFDGKTSAS